MAGRPPPGGARNAAAAAAAAAVAAAADAAAADAGADAGCGHPPQALPPPPRRARAMALAGTGRSQKKKKEEWSSGGAHSRALPRWRSRPAAARPPSASPDAPSWRRSTHLQVQATHAFTTREEEEEGRHPAQHNVVQRRLPPRAPATAARPPRPQRARVAPRSDRRSRHVHGRRGRTGGRAGAAVRAASPPRREKTEFAARRDWPPVPSRGFHTGPATKVPPPLDEPPRGGALARASRSRKKGSYNRMLFAKIADTKEESLCQCTFEFVGCRAASTGGWMTSPCVISRSCWFLTAWPQCACTDPKQTISPLPTGSWDSNPSATEYVLEVEQQLSQ